MREIIVLISILITTPIFSQIPNGSFENWEQENSWEIPTNWQTNNAEMDFVSVTKVESLTDGDYAMKVESKGTSFEGYAPGIAQCAFMPSSSFNNIEISYTIDSIEGEGNIEIVASQNSDSTYLQIAYWKQESITTGIQSLQLPLSPVNGDSLKIEVRANSQLTALGYEGHAEIIVDMMELSLTSSTINYSLYDNITLYPNPFNNTLILCFPQIGQGKIELFTMEGRKVYSKRIENKNTIRINNISELKSGIYIIKLNSANYTTIRKIIKNN